MKGLLLSILLLLGLSVSQIAAQEAKKDYNLLWEIAGNGLSGKSYIFGAIHMNDPRLFDLTDSLHFALSSAEGFAGEINFDSIGSLVDKLFADNVSSDEEEEADDDWLDLYDPHGYASTIDGYLYRVAKSLGKEIDGLEKPDSDLVLQDDLPNQWRATYGDDEYESFVRMMMPGNKDVLLAQYAEYYETLSGDVLLRHEQQLTSIKRLMAQKSYFFTVGISHLVGTESLITRLQEEGYTLRKVGYGKPTTDLTDIYESGVLTVDTCRGEVADYSYLAAGSSPCHSLFPGTEVSFGLDIGHGLLTAVMAVDLRYSDDSNFDLEAFAASYGGEGSNLTLTDRETHLDGFIILEDTVRHQCIQVGRSGNLVILQMLQGFNATSLETRAAELFFKSLQVPTDALTEELPYALGWQEYTSTDLGIRYIYPIEMEFVSSTSIHPDFPERDSVMLFYKNCTETDSGDEYLVKSMVLPSGIIFLENKTTIDAGFEELAMTFGSKAKNVQYSTRSGYPSGTCELAYKKGKMHLQTVVRASQQVILLQYSLDGDRNDMFFDALELVDSWQSFDTLHRFDMAPLSIELPVADFILDPELEEGEAVAYSFRDVDNQVSFRLAEAKFSTYEDYVIDDELLSLRSKELYELTDSMISFKSFKLDGETVGYTSHYKSANTSFHTFELHMAYLDKGFSMLAFVPDGIANTGYVEQLWNTVRVDKGTADKYIRRKAPKLLTDLLSRDSTTFYTAAKNLPEYQNFSPYDLPEIYKVVAQPLLDEEDGSTKYELIYHMNRLGYEVFEWEQLYPLQTNEAIQRVMLESLSQQYSSEALEVLFDYLWTFAEPDSLPDYIYSAFADSLEFYDNYYGELKETVDRGINTAAVLTVMQLWKGQGKDLVADKEDSSWFEEKVTQEIETYLNSTDTLVTGSVSSLIMDFLLDVPEYEYTEQVVAQIEANDDQFGKYRLAHNSIKNGVDVPLAYYEDLAESDYYRYWILDAHIEAGSYEKAPKNYRSKEAYLKAQMSYNMYEGYGVFCEECTVGKSVKVKLATGRESMYLVRCKTADDKLYIGCIGPYVADETVLELDASVYYSAPVTEERIKDLIKEMVQYVESR